MVDKPTDKSNDNPLAKAPTELGKLNVATRNAAAASLAGGIIAASGRPHSIDEAMVVLENVMNTMFPHPKAPKYIKWAADSSKRTTKHV